MIRLVATRLLQAIPILLGVSVVVFLVLQLVPGDPVSSLLGPDATPEAQAQLRAAMGLDDPLPVQYVHWLGDVVRGDLGRSIAQQAEVSPVLFDAFGNTLLLAGFAALVAIVGGLVLGAIGARWPRGFPARASSAASMAALSAPSYAVGLTLIIVLAVQNPIFPAGGMTDPTGDGGFADVLNHLWLPGITASLVSLGIIARMFRSALLDVFGQDFVEALRARGLSERRIFVQAVQNTLPSMLTVAGLQVGYLLGGVVFVETIFSWPGVGLLVYQAIAQRDLPLIQGGVLLSAAVFVALNIAVDTVHGLIDPRARR